MFTTAFWKDTAERAIATFAQVLVAIVTGSAGLDLAGLAGLDWKTALITSLVAAGLAVLKALVASKFGSDGVTPAFVSYEYVPPTLPDVAE